MKRQGSGILHAVALSAAALTACGGEGATEIARWSGNKRAAFALLFDDSMPSHLRNVVPELQKREITGTFYVNPGSGHWRQFRTQWETELPALSGVVYANHTQTHGGARDAAQLDEELRLCNEAIRAAFKHKPPALISFGKPGVKPGQWAVSDAELKAALKKHNLVQRPDTGGRFAGIHLKTAAEMTGRIDVALKNGSFDYVAFHGVGGEWLSIETKPFIELLDALVAKRGELWLTDTLSAHKYETERATAHVTVDAAGAEGITLTLSSEADATLYDQPLTLLTQVPPGWEKAQVIQAGTTQTVAVKDGRAMYDARPNAGAVTLKRAGKD